MHADEVRDILCQPLKLGSLTLANRMVMGPMAANAPNRDGSPSAQTIAFFEARARGGIGLIIAGGIIAAQRGFDEAPFRPLLRFDVDTFLPEFRKVADAVHAHGVPIIAELMPGFGRMGVAAEGRPLISASPINVVIPKDRFPRGLHVPADRITPVPQEATLEEIRLYEQEMIDAAARVQTAGWDGAEVAAHMSYFLASFLSPRTNLRTDEYGGSAENRARILVRIVQGIRDRTAPGFVVGLRITADDYMSDGQGPAGFAEIAGLVEAAGLDYVALSTGCYETMDRSAPERDGMLVESGAVEVFRQAVSVPILIQGIHDPAGAAKAIRDGGGDLAMFARPLLADPDFAARVAAGQAGAIRQCVRDNLCMRRMIFGMPVRCEVNPQMGRESRGGMQPPLRRMIERPVEEVILKLTGSATVMKLVGAVMPNPK